MKKNINSEKFYNYNLENCNLPLKENLRNFNNKNKTKLKYITASSFCKRQMEKRDDMKTLPLMIKKYKQQLTTNKRLQFELSIMRAEFNRTIKKTTLLDLLKTELKKQIKSLEIGKIKPISFVQNNPNEFFVFIGDLQYCGFPNELETFSLYFNYLREYCQLNGIEKINLCFMGDMVDGSIHKTSLTIHNKEVVQQSVSFSYALLNMLLELSRTVKLDVNYVCQDNHGELRAFNTQRGQFEKENINYMIGAFLDVGSKLSPNLSIKFQPHFNLVCENYTIHLTHGDLCKSPKQFENWLLKYRESQQNPFNYIYTGHFHHYERKQVFSGLEYTLIPTCKIMNFDYEKRGNYNSTPGILIAYFDKNGLVYDKIINEKDLIFEKDKKND